MGAYPKYINSEDSKEYTSGPPEVRKIDDTFYALVGGSHYDIWKSMKIQYNRENYATTGEIVFPRYNRAKNGKKILNFDEAAYIRSKAGVIGPGGKPLFSFYFASELMLYGIMENMEFNLNGENDETITFKCRDLMGELQTAHIPAGEAVPNLTSGEVVKKYVDEELGKYGVTCVIDPPTTDALGAFASSQYRFIPANKSKLDIIADMAAFSDRIFYLRGDKFYFVKPRVAADFPTWDVHYEKDTRKISISKNWSSEVLIVEGRSKPTLNSKSKNISAKSQMVVERVGHGSIIVKVPTAKTMKYGQGRNKEQTRTILRAYLQSVYDKMSERALSGTISDLEGRIDKREFNFKIRLLDVGVGLSQHYLPIEITHDVVNDGKYKLSIKIANVPEGAEEALQGGTFAPGEFTAEE